MRNGFKFGVGLILGCLAGELIVYATDNLLTRFLEKNANDEDYMSGLELRNPDLYQRLLKYRKEK